MPLRARIALALAGLVACSGHPARTVQPVAAVAAHSSAVPSDVNDTSTAEPPSALGFETTLEAGGWKSSGKGCDFNLDGHEAHVGKQSLHVACSKADAFFTASQHIAAATGQPPLRVRGFLRTRKVAGGFAGLWIRADGPNGPLFMRKMDADGPRGDTEWTRYAINLALPPGTEAVVFGVMLVGAGEAWFDELEASDLDHAVQDMISIQGAVLDREKRPVFDAAVALVAPGVETATSIATTDERGNFTFRVPAGRYSITATSRLASSYLPPEQFDRDVTKQLDMAPDGVRVLGKIVDTDGKPVPGALAQFIGLGDHSGDTFFVRADEQGTIQSALPPPGRYRVIPRDRQLTSEATNVDLAEGKELSLLAARNDPAPQTVRDELSRTVVPLTLGEDATWTGDTGWLAKAVGGARVVALGEATHGSREFYLVKLATIRFLVEQMKFRVIAIEANGSEVEALDDFLNSGDGDPAPLAGALRFWLWRTDEAAQLYSWLRQFNQHQPPKDRVHLVGMDMQYPDAAAAGLVEYFAKSGMVIDDDTKTLLGTLAKLAQGRLSSLIPERDRPRVQSILKNLEQRLTKNRASFLRHSSDAEWVAARRRVTRLRQFMDYISASPRTAPSIRDAAMAANFDESLSRFGTQKAILWAHNGHIASNVMWHSGDVPMGSLLRKKYGNKYFVLGLLFSEGSFLAIDIDPRSPSSGQLAACRVEPGVDGDLGAELAKVGSQFFLDLRGLRGPLAAWVRTSHPSLEVGTQFDLRETFASNAPIGNLFDAIIFVKTSTAAHLP